MSRFIVASAKLHDFLSSIKSENMVSYDSLKLNVQYVFFLYKLRPSAQLTRIQIARLRRLSIAHRLA